ncbi:MAG: hemerythrin domain-containing protein [Hydrogenophaga sp.]
MNVPLSAIGSAWPGHASPDAGFEAPFELLTACHERVHRMLRLLGRLQQHLADQGWDAQAADAARDVMRYFDLAAPLHHEDEELHVFPPLLAQGAEAVCAVVRRLQADHQAMERAWPPARALLQGVAMAGSREAWTGWDAAALQTLADFQARYGEHIRLEEELVYPAAQCVLEDASLQAMSADMQQRRTRG